MCSRLVDIKRVGFGNRNACRRLVEAWRVCFYRHETCRSPAEARRVHFVHRKMCRKPTVSVLTVDKRVGGLNRLGESVLAAEKRVLCMRCTFWPPQNVLESCGGSRRIRFSCRKACMRPAEVRRVCFDDSYLCRRHEESVLTTTKHVGGL